VRAARYIIFCAGLFGLWTLLDELKIWPPYLFPPPWSIAGLFTTDSRITLYVRMNRVLARLRMAWSSSRLNATATTATQ
jgi:hypothetical protein